MLCKFISDIATNRLLAVHTFIFNQFWSTHHKCLASDNVRAYDKIGNLFLFMVLRLIERRYADRCADRCVCAFFPSLFLFKENSGAKNLGDVAYHFHLETQIQINFSALKCSHTVFRMQLTV